MPVNINPAYRVHQILTLASTLSDSKPTLRVWTEVFGLDDVKFMDDGFETVRLLGLLKNEVSVARAQMQDTGTLDTDSYDFAFSSALEAINIIQLGNEWRYLKSYVSPEVLRMLRICSELTPAQETAIDKQELAKLDNDLVEFEASVIGSDLPADIMAFIVDQIHVIRRAILEYQVVGSKAFRRATVDFATNIAENGDLIEQNLDEEEVKTLATHWKRFIDIATTVSTLENALQAGRKLLELSGDVIDKI